MYIKDRLRTRVSKIICGFFLSLLLFLGIAAFTLWISLRPHRPRFQIREFSIPSLGQPNGFENAQIIFNVTCRNPNQHVGIYYDSMQGSVYYKEKVVGSAPLLPPFYQHHKNTTILHGDLSGASLTVNNNRWMDFARDRRAGRVAFRLEIVSVIRFKVSTWETKHHRMYVDCYVEVSRDGKILPRARNQNCPVYFK